MTTNESLLYLHFGFQRFGALCICPIYSIAGVLIISMGLS